MTEQEWLECDGPLAMLRFIRDRASQRKQRLFAVACCRRIWHLLGDERSRRAVEVAEHFADHVKYCGDRLDATAVAAWDALSWERMAAHSAAAYTCANEPNDLSAYWAAVAQVDGAFPQQTCDMRPLLFKAHDSEEQAQIALLRDIFGNPFRPVTVDPVCLTTNVVGIAQTVYDERAFDRMPILADALEDAGCSSREMLDHCRQPGEHVRGCWVVDLVLEKS